MGYSMNVFDSQFRIVEADKWLALAALHELARRAESIRWVDKRELAAAGTIEAALGCCGWEPGFDVGGNISEISFFWEKGGDEDRIFAAIAPFVQVGSYIEMVGEDGDRWRWCFDGERVTRKEPRLDWGE